MCLEHQEEVETDKDHHMNVHPHRVVLQDISVRGFVLRSKLRGVRRKFAAVDCRSDTKGSDDCGLSNPEEVGVPIYFGAIIELDLKP